MDNSINVILDACVLYSAPTRDLLLNLAEQELYSPKWSPIIQKEWLENLLLKRTDLTRSQLERTSKMMNKFFPSAMVSDFEFLIDSVQLPDQNDRHVVAAALFSNSPIIVTFNLKDFPTNYLSQFNIQAIHPDDFICELYEVNESAVKQAFQNQLDSLKNPPKTKEEFLTTLEKCGLKESSKLFRAE